MPYLNANFMPSIAANHHTKTQENYFFFSTPRIVRRLDQRLEIKFAFIQILTRHLFCDFNFNFSVRSFGDRPR
jgi:hypothetical protein